MSENFKKIKSQYVLSTIILSVCGGLCAGLFVVGVLLLAFKLSAIDVGWWVYLLVGAGCALLVGGGLFALIRPTDKKIAKDLDKEHGLDEKVQTMLEFADSDNSVALLQREDTEEHLSSLKKPKIKLLTVVKYAVIPIVSLGIFLTGVLIPSNSNDPDLPPDDFEMTNWQATALRQLINEVKSSSLESEVKASTVTVLQNLLDGLDDTQSATTMKTAVNAAIELIADITTGGNSYVKISSALIESADTENFGTALTSSAAFYKTDNTKIKSYDTVKNKEATAFDDIKAILAECASEVSAATDGKSAGALRTAIDVYTKAFTNALTASEIEAGDGLYDSIKSFSDNLATVRKHSQEGGYNTLQSEIESACATFSEDGAAAMKVQAYNCLMNDYIDAALKDIFGIADETGDTVGGDNSSTDDGDGGEDNSQSGSYGSGDKNYGSDDIIFYPATGEYVSYGEVLERYAATMRELIENGELSEELQKYINEYFDILYNGIE